MTRQGSNQEIEISVLVLGAVYAASLVATIVWLLIQA